HVALDDAVAAVDPEKDRPAGAASAAPNADEHIVGDAPPGCIHHVDSADVVAAEGLRRVGWVVPVPLRAIVDKKAVLDPAPPWPQTLAIRCRHRHALDCALPDVVQDAVADCGPLHAGVAVELDAVPADVLDQQIRNGHAGAAADGEQLAERAAAVEHNVAATARAAAEGYPVGGDHQRADHRVDPVGQEDGPTRPDPAGRRKQRVGGGDFDHLARRRAQWRCLRVPGLYQRDP